jgi:MFS family permease
VLGHLYGGVMVRVFGEYGQDIVDAFKDIGLSIAPPSWETLFILNIPISLLALLGAVWALRSVREAQHAGRFDILGTVFITLALIGLNLGLGTSPESAGSASSFEDLQGTATDYGPYLLGGAALAFLIFLVIEARQRYPLIRLGLFRSRNFSAASMTNFLVGFCLAIGLVSAPLLVNFRAESPTSKHIQQAAYVTGWLLSGLTVPMALAAIPGGWLSERRGHRLPTVLGLALAAIGFTLAGLTWEGDTSYWLMGAEMAVIGIGLGLTISPIGTTVINDAREEERGVASALILILRLVGMTVAISSLTIFSLDRVDQLVEKHESEQAASLGDIVEESVDVQFESAVQTIQEMQFIGAGVSMLGLLSALLLRGGPEESQQAERQERTQHDMARSGTGG